MGSPLPPGQTVLDHFPRFGLGKFANRFPARPERTSVEIRGDVQRPLLIEEAFRQLPRVSQRADFHCVTTWSVRDLDWGGVRFADFYERLVLAEARPMTNATFVVFRGEDGYCNSLPLDDLLAADVLLADQLGGQPLGIEHGAPLRLVAPAHYGYKNVKHLVAIEFWRDRRAYRFPFPYPPFMDHPRARVALEERGRWLPAWLLRPLYRLLVPSSIWRFARALRRHNERRKA